MWGGYTGDYNKKAGVTQVDVLDPLTEKWVQYALKGHLPTGLCNGATAAVDGYIYGYAFNTVVHLISKLFISAVSNDNDYTAMEGTNAMLAPRGPC